MYASMDRHKGINKCLVSRWEKTSWCLENSSCCAYSHILSNDVVCGHTHAAVPFYNAQRGTCGLSHPASICAVQDCETTAKMFGSKRIYTHLSDVDLHIWSGWSQSSLNPDLELVEIQSKDGLLLVWNCSIFPLLFNVNKKCHLELLMYQSLHPTVYRMKQHTHWIDKTLQTKSWIKKIHLVSIDTTSIYCHWLEKYCWSIDDFSSCITIMRWKNIKKVFLKSQIQKKCEKHNNFLK